MQQPQWSRSEPDFDEQETVFADQESVTPPTIPLGDQGPAPRPPAGPGFVRATPAEGTTPSPFSPQAPFGPQQPVAPAADQTMLISERPTPVFAWLVVAGGPDPGSIGSVLSLRPDTTTIGRALTNHITVRDETCSAQHARIRIEASEGAEPTYVLYDMGSSNGTFIGTKETYKDEENKKYRHELQDGDHLLVGETTLVFKKL
jgi:hypothetical protein